MPATARRHLARRTVGYDSANGLAKQHSGGDDEADFGGHCRGLGIALVATGQPAAAQPGDYYAGKTLRVIVGLEAGGTVDTFARTFSGYLRKHIPGNPTILVQNMPGAGGKTATNHVFERAAPDGLTMLYGPWDPLAQALGDQGLRARYEKFEFLGGTGDIRVVYGRRDMIAGGIKSPADIAKAETVVLGSLNNTDISGLLPHLALRTLGVKHKLVVGYRGGNDVFLALQRGEVNVHSTSITTFRGRNAPFVKSGRDRLRLSRPGRRQRPLRGEQVHHRDAGVPRSLQAGARQDAVGRDVGRVELAHQPDRRADLRRPRAAGDACGAARDPAQGL